jgi:hypothetical protein
MEQVTVEQIKAAKAVEDAARQNLIDAEKKRGDLEVLRACQLHSVGIGKIVADKKGRKGIVKSVRPWGDSKPWIEATLFKKDGSLGAQTGLMYDNWDVID